MKESNLTDFRVGIGFDSHPLAAERRLILGGVDVPFHLGLSGHSDGDVLVHAIMDALLGAAALGDKGVHFPSSDPQYKDISSLVLLTRVAEMVQSAGWRISNVDATMLAQNPRLGPYLGTMRSRVGSALSTPPTESASKSPPPIFWGSSAERRAWPLARWLP